MKKFYTLLIMLMTSFMAQAMSYSEAREQALYLTDKMAYELNLNQQQYNDCYEINLDYMLNVVSPSDAYGTYLDYRNSDLRSILHDWQYDLFIAADYFMRPLAWLNNAWSLAVYRYYDRTRFFYSRPTVFDTYRGGHSRHFYADGFYINRRPDWNGGLRGIDRPVGRPHSTGAREHRGYRIGGPISSPRGGVNPQRHSSGPGYSIGSPSRNDRGGYTHPSSSRTLGGPSNYNDNGRNRNDNNGYNRNNNGYNRNDNNGGYRGGNNSGYGRSDNGYGRSGNSGYGRSGNNDNSRGGYNDNSRGGYNDNSRSSSHSGYRGSSSSSERMSDMNSRSSGNMHRNSERIYNNSSSSSSGNHHMNSRSSSGSMGSGSMRSTRSSGGSGSHSSSGDSRRGMRGGR